MDSALRRLVHPWRGGKGTGRPSAARTLQARLGAPREAWEDSGELAGAIFMLETGSPAWRPVRGEPDGARGVHAAADDAGTWKAASVGLEYGSCIRTAVKRGKSPSGAQAPNPRDC